MVTLLTVTFSAVTFYILVACSAITLKSSRDNIFNGYTFNSYILALTFSAVKFSTVTYLVVIFSMVTLLKVTFSVVTF